MARFSGKIQSAKFVDSTEKTIEVLYGDTASKLSSWYLQVDYNNQDFLDFVEEVDLEVVGDTTHEFYNNQKSQYEVEIEAKASQLAVKLAEDMFEKWMANAQQDIKQEYDNIALLSKQEYHNVDLYKQQQLNAVEQELAERYLDADRYKQEQLLILEQELSDRFAQADQYKREQLARGELELEQQVQERYQLADQYKRDQLKLLEQEFQQQSTKIAKTAEQVQAELQYAERQRDRVEKQRAQLDEAAFKTQQEQDKLAAERKELKEKFKQSLESIEKPKKPTADLTGEQLVDLITAKNNNEDFLFKSKIALFNRDEVKKHPDREKKLMIRKATIIVDILAAYKDVIEVVNEETSL